MKIQYSVIIAYIIGIISLYVLGRLFLIPMKYVMKLIFNTLLGAVVLLLLNFVGGIIKFQIALNFISALVVGFLGIPGIVLLVILKYVL